MDGLSGWLLENLGVLGVLISTIVGFFVKLAKAESKLEDIVERVEVLEKNEKQKMETLVRLESLLEFVAKQVSTNTDDIKNIFTRD